MCQLHTHTQLTRKSRSNESMNDSSTNKVKLKHRKNKKNLYQTTSRNIAFYSNESHIAAKKRLIFVFKIKRKSNSRFHDKKKIFRFCFRFKH